MDGGIALCFCRRMRWTEGLCYVFVGEFEGRRCGEIVLHHLIVGGLGGRCCGKIGVCFLRIVMFSYLFNNISPGRNNLHRYISGVWKKSRIAPGPSSRSLYDVGLNVFFWFF